MSNQYDAELDVIVLETLALHELARYGIRNSCSNGEYVMSPVIIKLLELVELCVRQLNDYSPNEYIEDPNKIMKSRHINYVTDYIGMERLAHDGNVLQTLLVTGSHGTLTVDKTTGDILTRTGDAYNNLCKFDIEPFLNQHGPGVRNCSLHNIGYWWFDEEKSIVCLQGENKKQPKHEDLI